MSIPSLCKSISSKLSHDLQRAASREQRHAFAAAALDEMGKGLFPELDKLPVNKGEASDEYRQARATVADGRSVRSYSFTADSLTVGTRTLSRVRMSVLPGSGGPDHDGLLGMDFLKNFRYHVDFGRRVIEWSR